MGITVGMIGLGQIGMPVARLLLEAGHTVYGYRRHAMDDLAALGGIPARSPAEIGERCAVALICVPSDAALLDLVTSEAGLAHGARPGFVAADLSMLTLAAKHEARAALQEVGADMLDAPVSGIPPMVAAKRASYFVSGAPGAYEQARSAFAALGEQHYYLGEFGCGSAMKAVANLLVAVHGLAAAEAMVLAEKAGLDPQTVIDLIKPSIASSATFAVRAPIMAARAFEPPNGKTCQVQEFIGVIRSLSKPLGAPTPLLDTAARYFDQAVADGHGDQDMSSVFAVLARNAGLDLLKQDFA